MNSSHSSSTQDPGRILAMMSGYQQTGVLKAAIAVGLFTAVAGGARTSRALAEQCACAPRGARILADMLCVYGLLIKTDGEYDLAPDSAHFLDATSPAYLGRAADFLASGELIDRVLGDPAGWVRRGGPEGEAHVAPDNPIWVEFARDMASFMAPVASAMAASLEIRLPNPGGVRRILDVAAGHGLYGIEAARSFPAAQVVALDWKPVLEVARENAEAAGVGHRHSGLVGSAFDVELGGPYDLILIPNFLHHFSAQDCVVLLERFRGALGPGGALAIVEYCPDEDRVSPGPAALFALTMLVGTPEGDAYTVAELSDFCGRSGFTAVDAQPLPQTPETLLIAH